MLCIRPNFLDTTNGIELSYARFKAREIDEGMEKLALSLPKIPLTDF